PTPTPTPMPTPANILGCNSGITVTPSHLTANSMALKTKLTARGAAVIPTPWVAIDPPTNGVRVRLSGLLDVALPGGAAWTQRAGRWKYRDDSGSFAGITRLTIRNLSARQPGKLGLMVHAVQTATSLPAPDSVQMAVTFGTAAECAAIAWNGPAGVAPKC